MRSSAAAAVMAAVALRLALIMPAFTAVSAFATSAPDALPPMPSPADLAVTPSDPASVRRNRERHQRYIAEHPVFRATMAQAYAQAGLDVRFDPQTAAQVKQALHAVMLENEVADGIALEAVQHLAVASVADAQSPLAAARNLAAGLSPSAVAGPLHDTVTQHLKQELPHRLGVAVSRRLRQMPDGVAAEVAMTTTVAAVPAGRGHLVRRQEHIFSGTLIIVGAALSTLITAYWVHSYLTMTLPMRLRKRMNKNILSKALYWIVLVSGLYFLWAGFFLAGRSIYRTTSSLLRTKVFAPAETGENAGRQASKSLPKPASMPGAWVEEPIEPFIEDLPSNLGREATGVKDAVRSLSALKPAPSSKIPGVWEGKSVRRIVPELPTSSGRSVTTDAATLAKSGKVPTLSAKPDAAAVRSAAAPVGDLPQLEGSTVSSGSSVMTDATKLAKAGEVPKQPVELDAASVLPADEMLDGLSHLKGSPVSSDSFKAIPETDERPFHMPGSWVD